MLAGNRSSQHRAPFLSTVGRGPLSSWHGDGAATGAGQVVGAFPSRDARGACRPQGGGRRRADDRGVLAAIPFVASSGCTWRQFPPMFGASRQTAHRRFTHWAEARVRVELRRLVLDGLGARSRSASPVPTCTTARALSHSCATSRPPAPLAAHAAEGPAGSMPTRVTITTTCAAGSVSAASATASLARASSPPSGSADTGG